MNILGNSSIVITLSVLLLLFGVWELLRKEDASRRGLALLYFAGLLLFFVVHRYSSRIGSASPALNVSLLFSLSLPPALFALSAEQGQGVAKTKGRFFASYLPLAVAVLFLLPWAFYIAGVIPDSLLDNPRFALLFWTLLYLCYLILTPGPAQVYVTAAALTLVYAAVFQYAMGGFMPARDGLPLVPGIWQGLLWSLPLVLMLRNAADIRSPQTLIGLLPLLVFLCWINQVRGTLIYYLALQILTLTPALITGIRRPTNA